MIMWKKIIEKLLSQVWVQKIQAWFKKIGFTSLGYLLLFFITLFFGKFIFGIIGLKFIVSYLSGAFLGIFIYVNWNVIRKLIKEKIGKK